MRIFEKSPALRWVVPGVTAVALVAGGSAIQGIQASADTGLPARSAAQLLVDVQQARLDGLSGTVVQTSDLGLPSFPSVDGSGATASSDLSSLVSGSHTMRVWFAGPDQARMALLGTLGESDVIRNGQNLWVWASQTQSATHYVLPAAGRTGKNKRSDATPAPTDMPTTPQAAASQALAGINPSTEVTTSAIATVAGRSAYELVLKPREANSLVAEVRVAIDGTEHIPLRVQVFAKSVADPVFDVGFTSVDFARPDPAQFTFNPPPGTTVTQGKTPDGGKSVAGSGPRTATPRTKAADVPKVIGQGWDSVVIVNVPTTSVGASAASTGGTTGSTATQLVKYVSLLPEVSGRWGSGHLMAGTVFSALLTNDGRLVVGAVSPEGLYAALAAK
jgi:outer membrane lipoprotein-sorting protein